MEKIIHTTDELDNAGWDELIGIILSLQENIAWMTQNQELILEQIVILRGQCFGRHAFSRFLAAFASNPLIL